MRGPPDALGASGSGSLEDLAAAPWRFDFYAALRRVEARHPHHPRLGTALRPADEPVRLGQDPALGFAPAALAGVAPATAHRPPRIDVRFFGLFGPNGALPLHLTAYAHERLLNEGDAAFTRFADLVHHRLLLLFYRAWAQAQPTASADRPGEDGFADLVGALVGIGDATQKNRDAAADDLKRHFAGHLSNAVRSIDGLGSVLSGALGRPVEVLPFVGRWMRLPMQERTRLGGAGAARTAPTARLGAGAVLGESVWDRQHHITVRIGPLGLDAFEALLPGSGEQAALSALVAFSIGDELGWNLELELSREQVPTCRPGRYGRLGWTTWAGRAPHRRDARVTLHPQPVPHPQQGAS